MIDLRGIARRLRLSVDQLRLAADLLEQGYQPGFIERYRADETGRLSRETLWALKLEIDRQERLQAARDKAKQQLPKDAELDDESVKFLERATTEVEIEATLRSFRARRNLEQSQERSGHAGQLLERMISYDGPAIADLSTWTAEQLAVDATQAQQALDQTKRLVATLIQCDTQLNERLRRTVQKKAQVEVEMLPSAQEKAEAAEDDKELGLHENAEAISEAHSPDAETATPEAQSSETAQSVAEGEGDASPVASAPAEKPADNASANVEETPATSQQPPGESDQVGGEAVSAAESVESAPSDTISTPANTDTSDTASATSSEEKPSAPTVPSDSASPVDAESEKAAVTSSKAKESSSSKATAKGKPGSKNASKSVAKMTPRQRRRRWLIAMLQPMRSLKRPVAKLTAYQQLMLGRGRRSQLVKTKLNYDRNSLFHLARDAFVTNKHPLAAWFEAAAREALEPTWLAKVEADALADLEELAQEKLLEGATDQLRHNLMRRPIRGHVILVVDTVGPKTASVAIVGPQGDVLATDEISCSAHPDTVNQNVVQLGQLAHRHRVTLLALTNGPARRFLVLTVRELMKQSASSGLRWTMADRGGAEAYAAGRIALKELSAYNRRERAAIWVGRCLQNPLAELLKGDSNRLRLGSYQRELPQAPLRKLVRETISDCVSRRGIDTHYAGVDELLYVPGIENEQAQQIATLAAQGNLHNRKQLLESVTNWSEQESRQAIGLLRVFASDQTLDATAIHPDDYRLAQRLIENTDLSAPPEGPEGWKKPEAQADLTESAPEVASEETTSQAQGDSVEPSEETVVDSTDQVASEENTESPVAASEPSADVTSAEGGEASAEQSDSEPAASEATDTPKGPELTQEGSSAEEASPGDATSVETSTPPTPDATTTSETTAVDRPDTSVKPEYPEDVVPVTSTPPSLDVEKLAREWQVGREKLRWLASCLHDPFADPRLAEVPVPMLAEMPTISTLKPGMCLWAVVVGVADFGAFVEIAPDCSGLIHISRLSADYVEDPHQVVQVGDLIMAWVVSVDEKKNRVALTALSPAQRSAAESAASRRDDERRERRQGDQGGRRGRSGGRGEEARRGSGGGNAGRDSNRGGGRGGRSRGEHSGGRGRSRGPQKTTKPIVVTSKKPKAPISDAMKEGDEPLRSFSDLLQFYEAKRTDVPPPKSAETTPTETDSVSASEAKAPPPSNDDTPENNNSPEEQSSNSN